MYIVTHVGLVLLVLIGHKSYPQHQLLSIVIVENTVQILTKMATDFLLDLFHGELLVRHPLAIKFQTQQPRGDSSGIKVRHFVVNIDKLLILWDNCILRLRVIVDGRVGRNLPESGVLNSAEDIL